MGAVPEPAPCSTDPSGPRGSELGLSSRGAGQPAGTGHSRATRPAHGTAEHSTTPALADGRESRERWGPADTGLVKGSSRAKDTWLLSESLCFSGARRLRHAQAPLATGSMGRNWEIRSPSLLYPRAALPAASPHDGLFLLPPPAGRACRAVPCHQAVLLTGRPRLHPATTTTVGAGRLQ